MSLYPLYGRMSFYAGPYGDAKKDSAESWDANRLDSAIHQDDDTWVAPSNEQAEEQRKRYDYHWRINRDMATDRMNPRQELPKDVVSEQLIGIPDLLDRPMLDLSLPEDYKAHDQVSLVQQSLMHHEMQNNLYSDMRLFDKSVLNTDKIGKKVNGLSQAQLYSFDGSAAGKVSNFLDEDGYRYNSISSHSAF